MGTRNFKFTLGGVMDFIDEWAIELVATATYGKSFCDLTEVEQTHVYWLAVGDELVG